MGSVLEENIQKSFDRLTRRSFVRLGGLDYLNCLGVRLLGLPVGLSQLLEGRPFRTAWFWETFLGVLVVPVAVSSLYMVRGAIVTSHIDLFDAGCCTNSGYPDLENMGLLPPERPSRMHRIQARVHGRRSENDCNGTKRARARGMN